MSLDLAAVLAALAALAAVVAAVCSVLALSRADTTTSGLDALTDAQSRLEADASTTRQVLAEQLRGAQATQHNDIDMLSRRLDTTDAQVRQLRDSVYELRETTTDQLGQARSQQSEQLGQLTEKVQTSLQGVQTTVNEQLTGIRRDNSESLEQMRQTVDEKLQRTLNERLSISFGQVTKQLEEVNQGLGEMRSVAGDVSDLRKVLSNVKTRGIMGEVQLGAILEEMLAPSQYEENVATVPGSSERVEFAVRIPTSEGETIYLPIDSKFPAVAYEHLRDAQEAGDPAAVDEASRQLETTIKNEAKDIFSKYVAPPATTNFGIMFLPFEGLYAEVVNRAGLIEELQRTYHVSVCGPSTMAALLNSVQMSFQSVAIRKRADEIQRILAAIQAEFPKYKEALLRAQKQVRTVDKSLESLINTRTNQVERALRGIDALGDTDNPEALLGMGDGNNLAAEDVCVEDIVE